MTKPKLTNGKMLLDTCNLFRIKINKIKINQELTCDIYCSQTLII